ncbi:MAG: carboxypeptidase M32 [Deltaproteobacteria bacterium]|nr:carboxypeptidase M32 [Deltaproteobacteria bacterium]
MNLALNALKQRTGEICALTQISNLACWDQMTMMPPAGNAARSQMLAQIAQLENRLWRDPTTSGIIERLKPELAELPADSFEHALVRHAVREQKRALRVPPELCGQITQAFAEGHAIWAKAREQNNYALAKPALDRNIALARKYAACFPEMAHPGDALLALTDHGVTVNELRALFGPLRTGLLILLKKIQASPVPSDDFFRQVFKPSAELAFATEVVSRLGYDISRGRIDLAAHPFMSNFGSHDVRITTRIVPQDFCEAFTSAVHEAGHAMYEQGLDPVLNGTILARGTSDAVHESQSRLWENIVARHPAFWDFFFPRLQAQFPGKFDHVTKEAVVRAMNRVVPSPLRAVADEVTYNLHAIMRFDFELGLLEGSITTDDLPQLWRERMKADLGIDITTDAEGVLQDPHWFDSGLMLFHSYVLGNILSTQFFDAALKKNPAIPQSMAQGDFTPLRHFLTENIYRHGAKYSMHELLQRVTGQPPQVGSLLTYLNERYGALYGLAA